MKRFLLLCLTVFLLLPASSAALAADRVPLRVARLPLLIQSYQMPDADTLDMLETKLDRALHIPLNDTLHAMEYLPARECELALADVMDELQKTNRRPKLKDAMKPLAEKLQADLVVCPVVTDYEQYTYSSWNWNHSLILVSSAAVEIAGYEKSTDQVFDKEHSKFFRNEYSSWGTAAALAAEAMDRAIEQTAIHDRISKWNRNAE